MFAVKIIKFIKLDREAISKWLENTKYESEYIADCQSIK